MPAPRDEGVQTVDPTPVAVVVPVCDLDVRGGGETRTSGAGLPSARACLGADAAPHQDVTGRNDGRGGPDGRLHRDPASPGGRGAPRHDEATAPVHHWSDWYAAYIVAREQGRTQDEAVRDATQHMDSILR